MSTPGTVGARDREATAALARFTARFELDALPERVQRRLSQCLLDFVAVASGARIHADSTPAFLRGVMATGAPEGPATVIGERRGFSCRDAALLNGTLAHSLDFDDTNLPSLIHPGAAVIPAALALAEREDADGAALLAAVAAGYEVACRVGLALGPGAYDRGFHPTSVAGVFGAAAAGAQLLELAEEEIGSAFGLAGSMACGSMQYLASGSWNKRLHPGLAAQSALLALELARAGVDGASHALEGRAGVLHSYSEAPRPDAITDRLGERWLLGETGIKPYPACRLAHGAIDAAFALRARLGGEVPTGAELALHISPEADTIVGGTESNKLAPKNVVEAQFSVYFLTAVALLDGSVSWSSYERIGDADVAAMIDRIELSAGGDVPSAGALLTCRSSGGEVEARVQQPVGEPDGALAWEGVEQKYRALVSGLFEGERRERIAQWLKRLPSGEPVRTLTAMLRPAASR
jgi:2-methylcitrate dehydratase PrpD